MSKVTYRKAIEFDSDTLLKIYWIDTKPGSHIYHLKGILNENPNFFKDKKGMASIYDICTMPGSSLRIYEPLEGENCMWRTHNYEHGKRLPPGEEGACGREVEIFGKESEFLRVKYNFNIPEWMKDFAVDID